MFQDRYKSEAIEDEKYLLAVLRYVHQNPVKAGICKEIGEYRFSSYKDFIKENAELVDIAYVYSIIKKEEFLTFIDEKNGSKCLEYDDKDFRLTDSEARTIIQEVSRCNNITEFQSLRKEQRDMYMKELRKNGLSIRQISRLTGISFAIVRKL